LVDNKHNVEVFDVDHVDSYPKLFRSGRPDITEYQLHLGQRYSVQVSAPIQVQTALRILLANVELEVNRAGSMGGCPFEGSGAMIDVVQKSLDNFIMTWLHAFKGVSMENFAKEFPNAVHNDTHAKKMHKLVCEAKTKKLGVASSGFVSGSGGKPGRCFHCGLSGHIPSQCWQKYPHMRGRGGASGRGSSAFGGRGGQSFVQGNAGGGRGVDGAH